MQGPNLGRSPRRSSPPKERARERLNRRAKARVTTSPGSIGFLKSLPAWRLSLQTTSRYVLPTTCQEDARRSYHQESDAQRDSMSAVGRNAGNCIRTLSIDGTHHTGPTGNAQLLWLHRPLWSSKLPCQTVKGPVGVWFPPKFPPVTAQRELAYLLLRRCQFHCMHSASFPIPCLSKRLSFESSRATGLYCFKARQVV